MVFSLADLLFILHVILTNLLSLPMSAFVITSQFIIIPLWLLKAKSIWFLKLFLHLVIPKYINSLWLQKQCGCYDQFVFLFKLN